MVRRRKERLLNLSISNLAALAALTWGGCLAAGVLCTGSGSASESTPAEKAAAAKGGDWGDHVDSPLPEYVTGEECLFCHRDDWGNRWSRNFHQRTVRAAEADSPAMKTLAADPEMKSFVPDASFLLGTRREIRFLKRSNQYGKFGILSAAYASPPHAAGSRIRGKLTQTKGVHWDEEAFAKRCAGCHTTAVDPQTHAFSAISLDCYACHGIVDLRHSKETRLVAFGKGNPDPPRVQLANCAVSSAHGQIEKERIAVSDQFRRGGQPVSRFRGRFERCRAGADEPWRPARGPKRPGGAGRQIGDDLRQLPRRSPAKLD